MDPYHPAPNVCPRWLDRDGEDEYQANPDSNMKSRHSAPSDSVHLCASIIHKNGAADPRDICTLGSTSVTYSRHTKEVVT